MVIVTAHNLINDLLLIDIIALKLFRSHNSVVLPIHVIIPLAIVVIAV